MKRRVVITGATGFIGRQVLNSLALRDLDIVLVMRPNKEFKAFQNSAIKFIFTPDLFSETADWWCKLLEGVDTVIHLAWYVEPEKYLYSSKNLDCLIGSLNIAKGAVMAGVRRFVGIGTCFEYDLSYKTLSVDVPLLPRTPYAASKVATYLSLNHFFSQTTTEFAWCRVFYLYGEGEDSRRLGAYVRSKIESGENIKLSTGDQIRDYMNVCEAGAMISTVALDNQIGAINICSGIPISVRHFVERIALEYNALDKLMFGAIPSNPSDPDFILGVPNINNELIN
jgi:nucleoside-diphosphate-sugar epimerase